MSEEEKILKTIRYCANDYMKQEDGIQCFEWGDLWLLNEYIEKIKQENQQLKLDFDLYKDNHSYANYEVEKIEGSLKTYEILLKANDIGKLTQERDLYKEVIDEVSDMLDLIIPELWNINNAMTYKVKAVRRVLDKAKENK